jgi:hypothetical protein
MSSAGRDPRAGQFDQVFFNRLVKLCDHMLRAL